MLEPVPTLPVPHKRLPSMSVLISEQFSNEAICIPPPETASLPANVEVDRLVIFKLVSVVVPAESEVAKKLVVVAAVPVAFLKVRSWRDVLPDTVRSVMESEPNEAVPVTVSDANVVSPVTVSVEREAVLPVMVEFTIEPLDMVTPFRLSIRLAGAKTIVFAEPLGPDWEATR